MTKKYNCSDLDGNLSLGLGNVIAGGGERVLRIGQHFPDTGHNMGF